MKIRKNENNDTKKIKKCEKRKKKKNGIKKKCLINDLGTIHTDLDIYTDQFLQVKNKIKNKIHTIIG
jgi:hypothetical protein